MPSWEVVSNGEGLREETPNAVGRQRRFFQSDGVRLRALRKGSSGGEGEQPSPRAPELETEVSKRH